MQPYTILEVEKKGGRTIFCINCGVGQETGNFCGQCGVQFGKVTALTRQSRSQSQSEVVPFKEKLKSYWTHCLHSLKKPDEVLESSEDKFGSGICTILLFIGLLGLSSYGMNPSQSSILQAIGDSFLFIGVSMFIAIASVFIICKLFGPGLDSKEIIGLYGAYLIPCTALAIPALFLIILNSFSIPLFLLSISILYAILFLPLYLLTRLLSRHSSHLESHYSYIAYLVLFSSILSLYVNVALNASLLELLLWLNQF